MSCQLVALCVDANDPHRIARFWSGLLGGELAVDPDYPDDVVAVHPREGIGFRLDIVRSEEPKVAQNQMHLDLTSPSLEDQQDTVARALKLGGRHLDVGQLPEEGHVVLADPEGNELCVIGPGNAFLADCGFVGAIASDGSQEVGYFWSQALAWPLVWDQDQETAIRSPQGGPKITWGGPPIPVKTAKNRLHFDVAPPVGGDQQREVERLQALGATRIDIGQGDVSWVVMADPDGNEFCVLAPQ